MMNGLYDNRFQEVFSQLLRKGGVSCYQIYQYTGIDQAYLSRLRNGTKSNPSPEIVVKIGLALVGNSSKITIYDIEELMNATGRSLNISQ